MNHVIRHIEYLVHRHDCVVLPKWGAFIAHYQPACYDESLGLMYPPLRELSFSSSVDYNDGLLASSIARKESLPFVAASQIVDDELRAMKHQLNVDGEISLGKIGRFIRQDEVSVIFEPAKQQGVIASAGFEPMNIRSLMSKVREEAVNEGRVELPRRGRLTRLGLRAVKAAAAIALLVGVSVVLLRPSFNRSDDMASLAPVMPKSSQTAAMPSLNNENTLNILMPAEDKDAPAVNMTETTAASTVKSGDEVNETVAEAAPAKELRLNERDRYCLVIASFPTMDLANKFIRENSRMKLGILDKDDKCRVYAATGNTINEAMLGKEIEGVKSRFNDAWVCSMR